MRIYYAVFEPEPDKYFFYIPAKHGPTELGVTSDMLVGPYENYTQAWVDCATAERRARLAERRAWLAGL